MLFAVAAVAEAGGRAEQSTAGLESFAEITAEVDVAGDVPDPLGHGVADFPHLAGQGRQYLLEQLNQFKDGSRVNSVMQPIATALSETDKQAVAAYFSSLAPVTITVKPSAPETLKSNTGEWMATRGEFSRGIPACASCHGPQGRGVGTTFPMLAGLSANYITQQIEAWQKDARPAGTLGLMGPIAKKLTPAETRAVSDYFASLTVAVPAAPAAAAKPAASGKPTASGASK